MKFDGMVLMDEIDHINLVVHMDEILDFSSINFVSFC